MCRARSRSGGFSGGGPGHRAIGRPATYTPDVPVDLSSLNLVRESLHGRVLFEGTATTKRAALNWHRPGESDCLIKTKHCDGPSGC